MVFIGQAVSTPYGAGKVTEKRENDLVIVPTTWELAYGQKPTFYMREAEVKPLFSVNDSVTTVYGTGKVDEIRDADGVYIVSLHNWALADGKSPKLYLQSEALRKPKGKFSAGDIVKCMYGVGMVTDVRIDSSLVVVPSTWVLANNKPPVFYLNPDGVELVLTTNTTGQETATGQTESASPKKKKGSCTIS